MFLNLAVTYLVVDFWVELLKGPLMVDEYGASVAW
jgi:hypothetical protein